ncbi:Hypothetical predicted protein [Olea europaea subsp. europaea]|uniref:Uncharacterized protein n=1 Tax=Olea europaea subsp. europaea TaxID=158383 RepID=A0A8S0R4X9_OLEEU|nr:Hypothetical predicted protein [Olea europaea subsp. europaea]
MDSYNCIILSSEKKKQKISEIQATLDDAGVLVMQSFHLYFVISFLSVLISNELYFPRFEKWIIRQEACSQA